MKSKWQYILLLFFSTFSYAQVTLDVVQEEGDVKVDQRFSVTFVLEIVGNEYIQESPLKLPDFSKFKVAGNASNRNTYVDPKKNIVINQLFFQVFLEPKVAGNSKIGSALVQVNGKMYKTEPFEVYVKDADRKSNDNDDIASNDLYLNMEVKDKNIFTNQPTIAVLRAYSRDFDNFRNVGSIKLPNQNNVNIQTVSYKKSDIEPDYKGDLASQIIAIYMIFPSESGRIEIKPISAKIKHKNLRISSNKINLNVKKLPTAPSDFKNAVGNFTIELENNETKIPEINQPINLTLKIKGEGNFVNLRLPKIIENNDYQLFAPKISNHFAPANQSMKGEISADYILIPKKKGLLNISTENFIYFDPIAKKYVDLGAKSLAIDVMSQEEISDTKTALEKVNEYTNTILETVNTPVIGTNALQIKEKNKLNWKTILLNFSLFFGLIYLFYLLRKRYKKRKKTKLKTNNQSPIETIAEAEEKLRNQQKYSLSDELNYLEKLKDQKDQTAFFETYDELIKNLETTINKEKNQSLEYYFESKYGSLFAEKYKNLSKKISIEKYSPINSDNILDDLYAEIYQLFSDIKE